VHMPTSRRADLEMCEPRVAAVVRQGRPAHGWSPQPSWAWPRARPCRNLGHPNVPKRRPRCSPSRLRMQSGLGKTLPCWQWCRQIWCPRPRHGEYSYTCKGPNGSTVEVLLRHQAYYIKKQARTGSCQQVAGACVGMSMALRTRPGRS